jgi:hypothetical protein
MTFNALENSPKLKLVDILQNRKWLELLTSDKLEDWLENSKSMKYYYYS